MSKGKWLVVMQQMKRMCLYSKTSKIKSYLRLLYFFSPLLAVHAQGAVFQDAGG